MEEALVRNRKTWDLVAGGKQGRTALPAYGPLCPGEDELQLLGDIKGARVLELGCGDGKSLAYLHDRGASEAHGLDLSERQLENTRRLAEQCSFEVTLYHSPMERNPGIPEEHFDLIVSIYALGWTTDLRTTLELAHSYLRPGGRLVFSWEHPVFSCIDMHGEVARLTRSYSQEGPIEREGFGGHEIVMHARKLSTFANELCSTGFQLKRIIEGDARPPRPQAHYPRRWYREDKAKLMPTTVVFLATKVQ